MGIQVIGIPRAIRRIQTIKILRNLGLGHGGHNVLLFFLNSVIKKDLNIFGCPFVGILIGAPIASVCGTMGMAHGAIPDMCGFQGVGIRFEGSFFVVDPTKPAIPRPPFVGAIGVVAIPVFCAQRLETGLLDIHEPEPMVEREALASNFIAPMILRDGKQIRIHRRKLGVVVMIRKSFENRNLAALDIANSNPPEVAEIPVKKEIFPIGGHREMRDDARKMASADLLFAQGANDFHMPIEAQLINSRSRGEIHSISLRSDHRRPARET